MKHYIFSAAYITVEILSSGKISCATDFLVWDVSHSNKHLHLDSAMKELFAGLTVKTTPLCIYQDGPFIPTWKHIICYEFVYARLRTKSDKPDLYSHVAGSVWFIAITALGDVVAICKLITGWITSNKNEAYWVELAEGRCFSSIVRNVTEAVRHLSEAVSMGPTSAGFLHFTTCFHCRCITTIVP